VILAQVLKIFTCKNSTKAYSVFTRSPPKQSALMKLTNCFTSDSKTRT